jgi:ADP-heptose:LPS heptosyltransferase
MKGDVLVVIRGGIADHLLASSFISKVRKKFPKDKNRLVVLADYPEIYALKDISGNFVPVDDRIDAVYWTKDTKSFYSSKHLKIVESFDNHPFKPIKKQERHYHQLEAWSVVNGFDPEAGGINYAITDIELARSEMMAKIYPEGYVVVHPFSGSHPNFPNRNTERRDWDKTKWQMVINSISKLIPVVQIGLQGEHVFENLFSLVGFTSIRDAIAVIKKATMVVTVDNFSVQVAQLFNVPAVVLWGSTNPLYCGYTNQVNVVNFRSCPETFCGRPNVFFFEEDIPITTFGTWKYCERECLKNIEVAQVLSACYNILGGKGILPAAQVDSSASSHN